MADPLANLLALAQRKMLAAQLLRAFSTRALIISAGTLLAAVTQRLVPFPSPLLIAATLTLATLLHLLLRFRTPTQLHAALAIDQQWQLHELLSSAIVADDPRAIMLSATQVAARHRASQIDLRQLHAGDHGLRYWIPALLLAGLCPAAINSAPGPTLSADLSRATVSTPHSPIARSPDARKPNTSANTPAAPSIPADSASTSANQIAGDTPPASNSRTQSPEATASGAGLAISPAQPTRTTQSAPAVVSADDAAGRAITTNGSAGASTPTDYRATSLGQLRAASPPLDSAMATSFDHPASATDLVPFLDRQQIPGRYHDIIKAYFQP